MIRIFLSFPIRQDGSGPNYTAAGLGFFFNANRVRLDLRLLRICFGSFHCNDLRTCWLSRRRDWTWGIISYNEMNGILYVYTSINVVKVGWFMVGFPAHGWWYSQTYSRIVSPIVSPIQSSTNRAFEYCSFRAVPCWRNGVTKKTIATLGIPSVRGVIDHESP